MTLSGIAFDAFGTLFDLGALRGRADEVADAAGAETFDAFAESLLPLTWHATAAGHYRPFPELAALALESAARERGVELGEGDAERIAEGLASLPAFAGADAVLAELGHLPLAVLTNGTRGGIESLVGAAGIGGRFAHLLVADEVARFKPAPEVYALAVDAFGGRPESVLLVSGNEWDVAGAKLAGLRGAWIARGRPQTGFLGVHADVVADRLEDLPEAVRRLESG